MFRLTFRKKSKIREISWLYNQIILNYQTFGKTDETMRILVRNTERITRLQRELGI